VPEGRIFFAGGKADLPDMAALRAPQLFLAYRCSPAGGLARDAHVGRPRGNLMGVYQTDDLKTADAGRFSRDVLTECLTHGFGGVYIDFDPSAADKAERLSHLLASRGVAHFVPHTLAQAAPRAYLTVPSAISGGSYLDMLDDYKIRYNNRRLCLEVVRVCSDFELPAKNAAGRALSARELQQLLAAAGGHPYFSRELCAKYFTTRAPDGNAHFVLFDDPETVRIKIKEAFDKDLRAAFVMIREWGAAVCAEMAGERKYSRLT